MWKLRNFCPGDDGNGVGGEESVWLTRTRDVWTIEMEVWAVVWIIFRSFGITFFILIVYRGCLIFGRFGSKLCVFKASLFSDRYFYVYLV